MRKLISILVLGIAALLGGCGVVPVHSGGVVVRTTGGIYYPPAYHPTPYYGGSGRDARIQIRENEQGLVSFKVSQSGLTEPEVDWLLRRIDDLKTRCANGGEMKKYEIASVERANPYAKSRSSRGDTSVRIEYHCNRSGADGKPAPASGKR